MERETAPALHPISVIRGLAIDRFHQQELEVIGGSQVAWDTALCHRMLPQHATLLPSKRIPGLLVIIHDRLIEAALQFFQGHASRLVSSRLEASKGGPGITVG